MEPTRRIPEIFWTHNIRQFEEIIKSIKKFQTLFLAKSASTSFGYTTKPVEQGTTNSDNHTTDVVSAWYIIIEESTELKQSSLKIRNKCVKWGIIDFF